MKKIVLQCMLVLALVATVFVSCQKEEDQVSEPNPENLTKDSALTGLLRRMVSPDSISDNLVDSTACFRLNRPYKVFIHEGGSTIGVEYDVTVTDAETQQQLNNTLQEMTPGEDYSALYFPVTITFADGTEQVIHNHSELNIARMQCDPAGGTSTDPITCGNIVYPITIFSYNVNFQVSDTYTIHSDAELYAMISNVTPGQFFAIDFPISIALTDGTFLTAHNNQELVTMIQQAISLCGAPIINPCNNTNVLTDGLILYMPIGGETVDLISLNAASHTPNYPPSYVDDRSGNPDGAVSFSGNNFDYLKFNAAEINNGNGLPDSVSISLWYKLSNTNVTTLGSLFEKWNGTSSNSFGVGIYDLGRPLVYDSSNFNLWDPAFSSDNNWHHLVMVKGSTATSTVVSLYKDGQLVASSSPSSPIFVDAASLDYYFGRGFNGYLDDVRVYGRTLSADEVQTLHNLPGDVFHCVN